MIPIPEHQKYYWLKLKRDFFKRHDIRIIEEMPNGKDYILFYLKLLVESIDHNGELRFNDAIPYNEQMLAVITHTNVDIVRTAMRVFMDLNMVEMMDDQTIYMTEVHRLIGSERNPKQEPLENLARALRCDVDYLTGKSNTPLSLESIESVLGKLSTKELELFMSLRNLSTEEYEKKMDEIILFLDNQ